MSDDKRVRRGDADELDWQFSQVRELEMRLKEYTRLIETSLEMALPSTALGLWCELPCAAYSILSVSGVNGDIRSRARKLREQHDDLYNKIMKSL